MLYWMIFLGQLFRWLMTIAIAFNIHPAPSLPPVPSPPLRSSWVHFFLPLPLKKYMGLYTPKAFCENYSFTPKFYSTLTLIPLWPRPPPQPGYTDIKFHSPSICCTYHSNCWKPCTFLQICITSCGLYMYPEGVPGSIFAAYVPLMSHNPYPICI